MGDLRNFTSVEKTKQGIEEFLDCIHSFHDYRLERMEYIAGKDLVEVFLKFDTGREGVLLRFSGVNEINIIAERDYEVDWIYESWCQLYEDSFLWIENDDFDDQRNCDIEEVRRGTTCVMSDRLFFAFTDQDENMIEDPQEWFHQIWTDSCGTKKEQDFHFKKYDDKNWPLILKPKY